MGASGLTKYRSYRSYYVVNLNSLFPCETTHGAFIVSDVFEDVIGNFLPDRF